MSTVVEATDDPAQVLDAAGAFLASDPVRHNLILTLLHNRVAVPAPGRYWLVRSGPKTVGVVFQSPLSFMATLTPMPRAAVAAAVDAIAEQGVHLPGVNGVAATAARFAGQWTERTKSAATPVRGTRLYEIARLVRPRGAGGGCRIAHRRDRELLIAWLDAFAEEAHQDRPSSTHELVDRRLEHEQLWIWEDGAAVSMIGVSAPVAGVVRVAPVYTPPSQRNRGYASSLVGRISEAVLARGHRCMLYTDLANPTSNSVYRALGYRALDEGLEYQFADSAVEQ
jgi:uncharacterized protein